MLFDSLCSLVERYRPEMRELIEAARLFVFNGASPEIVSDDLNDQVSHDLFTLPFPRTAVEDAESCVVLFDSVPDQQGITIARGFIECSKCYTSLNTPPDKRTMSNGNTIKLYPDFLSKSHLVICGLIGDMKPFGTDSLYGSSAVSWGFVADRDGFYRDITDLLSNTDDANRGQSAKNAMIALQELACLYTPRNFVLEKAPAKVKRGNRDLIPRSDQRSIYTIVSPRQARALMRLPDPEFAGGSVTPHERRAHLRMYRDDRYTTMQGKTVKIAATWVGPSESRVGKHVYRVIL